MTPIAVAVSGGIGSGKTEACKMFASFGVTVLFTDTLARELIDTSLEIKKRLRKEFGPEVFLQDGKLDRRRMAKIVFTDDSAKERLDNIVHPYVLEEIRKKIASLKRRKVDNIMMVESALIFESGAEHLFDYIIVIDADEAERIERIVRRDHVTRTEVLQRIKSQMPAAMKKKKADFILQNSGDMSALRANCRFIFTLLQKLVTSNGDQI